MTAYGPDSRRVGPPRGDDMTCAPGGCGCGHEHDGHHHGGHDDDTQHATTHGAGCCGGPAVSADNPKPAEKA